MTGIHARSCYILEAFLPPLTSSDFAAAATRAVSCRGPPPASGRSGGWPRGRCDGAPQPASLPPPLLHIVRFAANPDAVGERGGSRYGTTADLPLVGVDLHSIEVRRGHRRTKIRLVLGLCLVVSRFEI